MNTLLGIYSMRILTTILHRKILMSGDKCFVIKLQYGTSMEVSPLVAFRCSKKIENDMLSQLQTLNHKNQKEHVIHYLEANNYHINSHRAWCEMVILGDRNPVIVSCISSIIFVQNISSNLFHGPCIS